MDVKSKIKQSVEYKKNKHDIIVISISYLFLVVFAAIIIFSALYNNLDYAVKLFALYVIVFSCLWVPFASVFIYNLISLCNKTDKWIFFVTTLNENKKTFGGKKFVIDLSSISINIQSATTTTYSYSSFKQPCFDDYVNKTVTAGYNPETGKIIIINTKI